MRYFGFQLKELLKRHRFKIASVVAAAIYGIAFIIARQSFLSDQEYARFIESGINTVGSLYPWYRKPLPIPRGPPVMVEIEFRYLYVIESDLIGGALVTALIAVAGLTSGWLIDKHYLNKTEKTEVTLSAESLSGFHTVDTFFPTAFFRSHSILGHAHESNIPIFVFTVQYLYFI